ncbi:MAG: hypothetical protein J0M15_00410 [Deltaproteobacteria bacterium]|nr:hypothetical protein [Deltaproteobacteria bacterium]
MCKKMSFNLTVLLVISIEIWLLAALPSVASDFSKEIKVSLNSEGLKFGSSKSSNLNNNVILPGKKIQKPQIQEKNLFSNGNSSGNSSGKMSQSYVQSYKEWRQEKIQRAKSKVALTRAQITQINSKKLNIQNLQNLQKAESSSGLDLEIEKLEAKLKNDLFSLEVAQQLTVQDYFAIYLTKLENKKEAYKGAAEKMNTEEVTELINAFADSFSGTQSNGITGPSAYGEDYAGRIR